MKCDFKLQEYRHEVNFNIAVWNRTMLNQIKGSYLIFACTTNCMMPIGLKSWGVKAGSEVALECKDKGSYSFF